MLPIRLELRNFLAYRNKVELSFEGLDLAVLSGANGAGKSSLLDAMTWALWGRSRAPGNRADDMLIHLGQHEMYVSFDFRQEDRLYRVRREYKRGKTGQSALYFYFWDAQTEQFQSLTESVRETQDKINRLLKLDYETFVDSAFVQQGKADSFTSKTPGKRKDLLYSILGLDRWERYEKQAKVKLDELNAELAAQQASIEALTRDEGNELDILKQLAEAETERQRVHAEVEAAQTDYDAISDAPKQRKTAENEAQAIQRRIKQYEQELSDNQSQLERQQKRLATFNAVIARREEIEAAFGQLEQARAINDEQSNCLSLRAEHERKLTVMQRQLDGERAKLVQQISIHRDRIKQGEALYTQLPDLQRRLAVAEAEIEDAKAHERQLEERRDAKTTLTNEITRLNTTNETLRSQMNALAKKRDTVKSLEVCPTCGQVVDDSHREHYVNGLEVEGKTYGDTFRANKTRVSELEQEITNYDAEIARLGKLVKAADKAKADLGRVHESIAKAQEAGGRLDEDIEAAERLETQLAEEQFAVELRSTVAVLQQEIGQIGYDKALHDQARTLIGELKAYDAQMRELQTAVESAADVEVNIAHLSAQVEQKQFHLDEERKQADTIKETIRHWIEQEKEAFQRNEKLKMLRQTERGADEKKIGLEQKLRAIREARQHRLEREQKRDQLIEEIALYDDLKMAFSKNGVPAMIIETAIPELEETTNRLLTRMTDGRMAVRFDTQRTNKDGGTLETLDILISDELGQRSYDMFSGGEGFRINFALRIALSQFLARRAGGRLQTLVIDEGFGSQDAVGRERIVEAINAIRADFDMILIVTHIEELLDLFPARIEVRKTPEGSIAVIR
ncbi:MAG: SMC family ATPase [Anaerolineae bacterium]|nr:SMC family ATPase [Anaerolineae bacterium]